MTPSTLPAVVFIGAGPGAADLITVRGAQRLAAARVVLFDALTDPALRDLAPAAEWIAVGKRGFDYAELQANINALLLRHAPGGGVVRLKGGDPSIFGRLEEELQALQAAGHACEVVPGVTSALAAAAQAGRPLTRRGSGRSVSLTTAMTHLGRLQATRTADTEVFYMAGRQLAELSARLREAGWADAEPVSVMSRAGWPDALLTQHTVATLAEAAATHAGRPAVVTVGAGAAPVLAEAAAPAADLPGLAPPQDTAADPAP
ncbi:uroporphyrinogen-III C-methyltransferase [Aquabacterium sp. OR-4]|uniref:uroporphyrinogen-III C-methyltransferase n=1 Tax=Aquabacterium sp. OR-4 TaxID=2978127 RepID=UPI0021B18C13|nr:uroporphyrinogen-III C-methyltransferase [Aquabacterium sp. OR-4]MDT7835179.1 uroporphyrinogen-III C-methyltransferase [Aquabacterium sp. OR-4]